MTVVNQSIEFETKREGDIVDLTPQVAEAVANSGLAQGVVTLFAVGSTGAISTMEYEPGLLQDIPQALERIAPRDQDYQHHQTWGCDNGRSHVKATLLGPSLSVPFLEGRLTLGTWQQIAFLELDTRPRRRKIIMQIMGE